MHFNTNYIFGKLTGATQLRIRKKKQSKTKKAPHACMYYIHLDTINLVCDDPVYFSFTRSLNYSVGY